MFKFLLMLFLPIAICCHSGYNIDMFNETKKVEIYKNGQLVHLTDKQVDDFENIFSHTLEGAEQVPCIFVALNDSVNEDLKEGNWIKFIFNKTVVKYEMPFDEILINVHPNYNSLTLLRGNNGRFEGRCIELQLKGDTNNLFNFLNEIDNQTNATMSETKDKTEEDKQIKNIVIDISEQAN